MLQEFVNAIVTLHQANDAMEEGIKQYNNLKKEIESLQKALSLEKEKYNTLEKKLQENSKS